MYAANRGHFTSLKLLIDANAHPDLISEYGETALICAAQESYPDIVAELARGDTALHLGAANGHESVGGVRPYLRV